MSALAEAPPRQKRKFFVDFPFTKEPAAITKGRGAEEPGEHPGLWLTGYANTWVQDRDGDYVDPKAFDDSLGDYLRKNPIVLHQHKMDRSFGQVHEADVDDTGLWVRAFIPQPTDAEERWKVTAYNDTARGVLRTFSIGGYFHYDIENLGEDDEKWIIRTVELFEISVVSIPSNPDSIFEAAAKAIKTTGDEQVGHFLSPKAHSQMLQLLGAEDITDPDLVLLDDDGKAARYMVLARLFKEDRGAEAPDYELIHGALSEVPDDDLDAQIDAFKQIQGELAKLWTAPARQSKSGRVLSKANEDRLAAAVDSLDSALENVKTVLEQVQEDEQEPEAEPEPEGTVV